MFSKRIITIIAVTAGLTSSLAARPHHGGPPGKGCPMEYGHGMSMADANNDGKVSKEEWLAHFNEIDADKNGSITSDEVRNHRGSYRDKMDEKRFEEMHKKLHEKMKK